MYENKNQAILGGHCITVIPQRNPKSCHEWNKKWSMVIWLMDNITTVKRNLTVISPEGLTYST